MMGHHFGVPFHEGLQRRIILEALDLVIKADRSSEVRVLPIRWAQARREGKAIEELMGGTA